jgi:hypothetical protein
MALADEARDAVDELHDLDVALEQREQRPSVALVRRILAGGEADVRGGAREPLPALGAQRGEVGDALDLLGRDHERTNATECVRASGPTTAERSSASRCVPAARPGWATVVRDPAGDPTGQATSRDPALAGRLI